MAIEDTIQQDYETRQENFNKQELDRLLVESDKRKKRGFTIGALSTIYGGVFAADHFLGNSILAGQDGYSLKELALVGSVVSGAYISATAKLIGSSMFRKKHKELVNKGYSNTTPDTLVQIERDGHFKKGVAYLMSTTTFGAGAAYELFNDPSLLNMGLLGTLAVLAGANTWSNFYTRSSKKDQLKMMKKERIMNPKN